MKNYITLKKLIRPVEYGAKNSNGVDLSKDCLVWLRDRWPGDLEKVLNVFPKAGSIIFEHDYEREQTAAQQEDCAGRAE